MDADSNKYQKFFVTYLLNLSKLRNWFFCENCPPGSPEIYSLWSSSALLLRGFFLSNCWWSFKLLDRDWHKLIKVNYKMGNKCAFCRCNLAFCIILKLTLGLQVWTSAYSKIFLDFPALNNNNIVAYCHWSYLAFNV